MTGGRSWGGDDTGLLVLAAFNEEATDRTVGTAPKAFTLRYYLARLGGYSAPLAKASVTAAERLGIADRLVAPDFRDRMAILARVR